MHRLHVATLNIRNLADRWPERLPLLLADMAGLQPDVLGLQEVVYPMHQDRVLGSAGERHYEVRRGWAGRPEYGNSLLFAENLEVRDVDRLDLGLNRSALRATVRDPSGTGAQVVVTHLHHEVDGATERDEQVRTLLSWLDDGPASPARVVVGDFNAHPREAGAARMRAAGYRSAHAEANGADPDVTWPSGIQAPGMDTDGDPSCLDYIWVRGDARVLSARLVFDRPHPEDPTLYPSDHLGLSAVLDLGADAHGAGH